MAAQLRVYPGSADPACPENQQPTIRIRVSDLLPLLALAKRHNYLWLQDFLDDEVRITPDMYDVLRAFNAHRRPSA